MSGIEIALAAAAVTAVASTAVETAAAVEQADYEADVAKAEGQQRQQAAAFEERQL